MTSTGLRHPYVAIPPHWREVPESDAGSECSVHGSNHGRIIYTGPWFKLQALVYDILVSGGRCRKGMPARNVSTESTGLRHPSSSLYGRCRKGMPARNVSTESTGLRHPSSSLYGRCRKGMPARNVSTESTGLRHPSSSPR